MTRRPPAPQVTLALYRDPRLLRAVERPKFAESPPSLIVELALQSRLRGVFGETGEAGMPVSSGVFEAPIVFAPARRFTARAALHGLRWQLRRVDGPVVLLCHVDDAADFVESLSSVVDVRLVWHPADRADGVVEALVERFTRIELGGCVGPYPVYFCAEGRPATAEDWRRAVVCPVLGGLAAVGRARHRRQERPAAHHVARAGLPSGGPARRMPEGADRPAVEVACL